MQQVLDKTARESEASTARKPQTQLEFDWRTQITINEANNYWLTDEWWNLLKTSFPSPASTKYVSRMNPCQTIARLNLIC